MAIDPGIFGLQDFDFPIDSPFFLLDRFAFPFQPPSSAIILDLLAFQSSIVDALELDAIVLDLLLFQSTIIDALDLPMNISSTTTAPVALAIGSNETFETRASLNGEPWSLAGGSALLKLTDPTGGSSSITGSIVGQNAVASWTVVAPVGAWTRAWVLTDATGLQQVSLPISFDVVAAY